MSNIVKYRIVLADNQGSFAIDGLARVVTGGHWYGTVDRYNGIHDLAHIEVPADEAEYFESVLDADDNVIEYETC